MSPKFMTRITIRTRETVVVRSLGDATKTWCAQCGEAVLTLAPEAALEVMRILPQALAELLQAGSLHVIEPRAPAPLICCNSISSNPTETEILIEGEGL